MAEINIQASKWKLVEIGRVVLFNSGPYANRLATIVEIIDHKRVCLLNLPIFSLAKAGVKGPRRRPIKFQTLCPTPFRSPKLAHPLPHRH